MCEQMTDMTLCGTKSSCYCYSRHPCFTPSFAFCGKLFYLYQCTCLLSIAPASNAHICSLVLQESGVRRGKVLAAADQYAQLINGAIETIVEQSINTKSLMKSTDSSVQPTVRQIPLPPSIIGNTEPFRHGDWRKEPYSRRSASLSISSFQKGFTCSYAILLQFLKDHLQLYLDFWL